MRNKLECPRRTENRARSATTESRASDFFLFVSTISFDYRFCLVIFFGIQQLFWFI